MAGNDAIPDHRSPPNHIGAWVVSQRKIISRPFVTGVGPYVGLAVSVLSFTYLPEMSGAESEIQYQELVD